MIRLSLSTRPEAWQELEIIVGGEPQAMRVRYWLLSTAESAEWTASRLQLAKAVRTDNQEATFDQLLDDIKPEHMQKIRALLIDRVIDWDLVDGSEGADGKLPVNPDTVGAVLDRGMFWRPMFQGLLDASAGSAVKKTV